MVTSNMDWIKLAMTGGRDPNLQLAATGRKPSPPLSPGHKESRQNGNSAAGPSSKQQPNTPQSSQQTATPPTELNQTLVFCVDQYDHAMEGAVIRFQVLGGSKPAPRNLVADDGEVEAAGVLIPKQGGFIKVWADLEDKIVAGGGKIEPNDSGKIYVKVSPVSHDRVVSTQTTTGQTRQGNQVTVGASASATASGHIPFVADGTLSGTASVQNQFARSDTSSSTQETVTEPTPVVTGLIITAAPDRPSVTSGLTTSTTAFG